MRKATLFNIKQSVIRWASLLVFVLGASLQAQAQCPPVTVFCQDLHTSFMADACMVEVWAKDFISKINNHETSLDDYIISFEEDSEVMSRTYESFNGNTYEVSIWVTSRCDPNQQTRCVVNLDINDNSGACPTEPCLFDSSPWCGYAVITCSTVQGSASENTGHTAAIIDIRKNSQAPRGDDWSNPSSSGQDPVDLLYPEAWRIGEIGNVFGIAVNPTNGQIFLGASDIYDFDFQQFITIGPPPPSRSGVAGTAGIYRSSFSNPENTNPFITTRVVYPSAALFDSIVIGSKRIPNTGNIAGDSLKSGNGIANLDVDIRTNHLFASNLEDGKIYSIDMATGTITDVLDPFTAYVHTPGMVQSSERVWGLAISDCSMASRLYFVRGTITPSSTPDVVDVKQIWSIAINPDGTFAGSERLEFRVGKGDQDKITDISLSADCTQMLLAERGNPHSSELNQYILQSDGTWALDRQFFLGLFDPTNVTDDYPNGIRGNSVSGGSSYGPAEAGCVIDASCDNLVWGTMNCGDIASDDSNPPNPSNCAVYGAQGISSDGNSLTDSKSTDIFVGLERGDLNNPVLLKSNIGDIEIFNCCCPFDEGRQLINAGMTAIIAGEVYTEEKSRIVDTEVKVASANMSIDIMTNKQGEYLFEDLAMHYDYSIVPSKAGKMLDGITTLDLVLIQRHILGLSKLDSPYKILAADIDNSQNVSAIDLVYLRKLILGIAEEDDFASWTFVPASYEFEDLLNPFPYDHEIALNDLESNAMHQNFVAIKVGDVNADNSYNLDAGNRSNLQASIITHQTENHVYFSLNKDMILSGMQFEIVSSERLSNPTVSNGALSLSDANFYVEDNSIKLSWNESTDRVVKAGEVLFSIEIGTQSAVAMNFNNADIKAQAYNHAYEAYDLSLVNEQSQHTSLIGSSPNPFSDNTNIHFEMSSEEQVAFEFFNIEGRKIHSIKGVFGKGRNSINISLSDIRGISGNIIVYKMITKGLTETGKLLVID